jgi:hypothetical protein
MQVRRYDFLLICDIGGNGRDAGLGASGRADGASQKCYAKRRIDPRFFWVHPYFPGVEALWQIDDSLGPRFPMCLGDKQGMRDWCTLSVPSTLMA